MKKRILIALSAMFVFGLFGAVFALSGANATTEKTAVSCPMHKQNAETASGDNHKDSCCGMANCCQDGKCSMGDSCCQDKDSCPMKKRQENQSDQTMDLSKVTVVTSDGADCCKGGACCHKKS